MKNKKLNICKTEIYKIQKRSLSYMCVVKDKNSSVTKLANFCRINYFIRTMKKVSDAAKIVAETGAEAAQKASPAASAASSHSALKNNPVQDPANPNTPSTQYSKIIKEKQDAEQKTMQDNFEKNKKLQKDLKALNTEETLKKELETRERKYLKYLQDVETTQIRKLLSPEYQRIKDGMIKLQLEEKKIKKEKEKQEKYYEIERIHGKKKK